MNRLRFAAFTFLWVVVLLVVTELICRVVLRKVYNRSFDSSLIQENKYGNSAGLKENAEGMVWGKKFHTDELGTRKHKPVFDKKKGTWLYIGDSVTEGVGVEDSSTFASLNADEFAETNLLNYSLIGYSVADYVNVLNTVLAQDSSVELVTLFYCLNDVYGGAKTKELPVMAKQNVLGKANALLQDRYATYKLLKLLFYKNNHRYFDYDLQFYEKSDEHFANATCQLYSCDSVCKARGIYFNVVALPYRSQLETKNFLPQQMLKEFCVKHQIEFSDAAEGLLKEKSPASLYLFADEIHLSKKGHRAVAEYLSR